MVDWSRWKTHPYYALVIFIIACGSIPKGYDEGGFSASVKLESFKEDYNLIASNWTHDKTGLANRSANITSFNVLGAAFGALFALDLNDRFGRLNSWRLACLVWASGLFIQVFSSGIYGLLLFARIWSGLGAGALTVTTPLYLSEIVGLAMVASYIVPETPRYLVSKQKHDEGRAVLARLRGKDINDPELEAEFALIDSQVRAKASDLATVTPWTAFKETQTNPNYRQRFWLLIAMHTIAQWTGGNGITYYISTIFQYAGVTGNSTSLISSGAYGIVKLVFTMAFTWGLIDLFGRRRCALAGLSLQLAAHIYMGVYMGLQPGSSDNKSASDAAIASVFVYAVGWSIGLCTIPYLYGTEIFPTRIRNVSYAISMSLHWFFQFAVVRVTPNMFASLNVWGAYLFWAIICTLGLVILGIWMPETKGVPIERMGDLFDTPWYLRWRARPKSDDSPETAPSVSSSTDAKQAKYQNTSL
ncbi:hypothetical protein APSETT444_008557 [Aspergillus pseudonomiae]